MELKKKIITLTYTLYTEEGDKETKIEEMTGEKPLTVLTGFGLTLEDFEKNLIDLNDGDEFDFTLTPEQAYGNYDEKHVIDMDREIFSINGHFDSDNIFVGAVVPLQNEDGNRFMGKVLEITSDKVKMDLNHPLSGKDIRFAGHIIETRDATNEEIQNAINAMSGEGGEHHCCCGHHHGEEGEHECHCHDHEGESGEHHCCGGHHHGEGEHECHCHDHESEDGEHHCHCHDND